MSSCSSTRMVEYLEPLMSKELLCKFPDNSAFDFDYTQSSIWSPLVPRSYTTPMDSEFDLDLDFFTPKKLKFEIGLESSNLNNKVASKSKNKFKMNSSALKRKKSKNKRKMAPSDFSPTSIQVTCNLAATKMWNKMLKAACKHFKRMKKNPKAHVRLSNNLTDGYM